MGSVAAIACSQQRQRWSKPTRRARPSGSGKGYNAESATATARLSRGGCGQAGEGGTTAEGKRSSGRSALGADVMLGRRWRPEPDAARRVEGEAERREGGRGRRRREKEEDWVSARQTPHTCG